MDRHEKVISKFEVSLRKHNFFMALQNGIGGLMFFGSLGAMLFGYSGMLLLVGPLIFSVASLLYIGFRQPLAYRPQCPDCSSSIFDDKGYCPSCGESRVPVAGGFKMDCLHCGAHVSFGEGRWFRPKFVVRNCMSCGIVLSRSGVTLNNLSTWEGLTPRGKIAEE